MNFDDEPVGMGNPSPNKAGLFYDQNFKPNPIIDVLAELFGRGMSVKPKVAMTPEMEQRIASTMPKPAPAPAYTPVDNSEIVALMRKQRGF